MGKNMRKIIENFLKKGVLFIVLLCELNTLGLAQSAEEKAPTSNYEVSINEVEALLNEQLKQLLLIKEKSHKISFPEKDNYSAEIPQYPEYCKQFWEKLGSNEVSTLSPSPKIYFGNTKEKKLFLTLRPYISNNYKSFLKQKKNSFPKYIAYEGASVELNIDDPIYLLDDEDQPDTGIYKNNLPAAFKQAWQTEDLFLYGDNLPQGQHIHFLYIESAYLRGFTKPAVVTVVVDQDEEKNNPLSITGIKLRRVRIDGIPESGSGFIQLISKAQYTELKKMSYTTKHISEPYEPFSLMGLAYFKNAVLVWGLRPGWNSDNATTPDQELLLFRIDNPSFDGTPRHCSINIQ